MSGSASTDIPCSDLGSTTITVGAAKDLETTPPTTSTTSCGADGFVGTLVIVPAGSDDDTVGFKVVSGSEKRAEQCAPPEYKGCVVERRALHYLPNHELRVNVAVTPK